MLDPPARLALRLPECASDSLSLARFYSQRFHNLPQWGHHLQSKCKNVSTYGDISHLNHNRDFPLWPKETCTSLNQCNCFSHTPSDPHVTGVRACYKWDLSSRGPCAEGLVPSLWDYWEVVGPSWCEFLSGKGRSLGRSLEGHWDSTFLSSFCFVVIMLWASLLLSAVITMMVQPQT